MQKNDKKIVNGWCMYDWANSVFSLVITTTIFPIYFNATAQGDTKGSLPSVFGLTLPASALFSYCISFSFLLVALVNPVLTGIADYSGNKKGFMKAFCYLGAFSCASLAFFVPDTTWLGIGAFVLATVGFCGSLVFYNAFLPDIATEDQYDRISAKGYAFGYVGSVVLQILVLLPILFPQWFWGVDSSIASRIAFGLTGAWWFGFSQISFGVLADAPSNAKPRLSIPQYVSHGYAELAKVISAARAQPTLLRYLLSFFFYNMGVQTVMYLATLFGEKELHLPTQNLIITFLLLQLLAIIGALGFARLSKAFGNLTTLTVILVVWLGICGGAWFVTSGLQFYALASVVGLVMGGVQSLSRSTYARYLPAETKDTASYFSLYDFTDKIATVIGTFTYGLIEILTGSMRNSVLALGIFFVIGIVLLSTIKRKSTQIVAV